MNHRARCEPLKCATELTMSLVKFPGLQPTDIRLYFMVQLKQCDGRLLPVFYSGEEEKGEKKRKARKYLIGYSLTLFSSGRSVGV